MRSRRAKRKSPLLHSRCVAWLRWSPRVSFLLHGPQPDGPDNKDCPVRKGQRNSTLRAIRERASPVAAHHNGEGGEGAYQGKRGADRSIPHPVRERKGPP